MCRVFGCVAAEPVSIRHELVEAKNPLIRQSEDHDSGWGMAMYANADGCDPEVVRYPNAAHDDGEFLEVTSTKGRIFNVHVRRATMGDLRLENTHPFCLGGYSLGHNGTIVRYPRLLEDPHVARPQGDTDSEAFFNFLMACYHASDPIGSLRRAVSSTVQRSSMSGLNFLFSDGDRLYAYRLGLFDLHWLHRPGQLLVASEQVTGERWHTVQQDVLLVLDPDDLEEPHAERLIGDELLSRAHIHKVDKQSHLRGEERGAAAAARARAAVTGE
jgi:predicted glutamine amidotransferase